MADAIISEAAILEKQNEPLVVDLIEIPQELETGQVLVQVHASAICGSQLGEISGAAGPDPYLPHLLGHEGGGVVKKTGPCVSHVYEGDHVVMHWRPGPGIEANCPMYKWRKGEVGGGPVTTFNTYAVVSENRLISIGKRIPFDIAALMGCSVTTGLGIVIKEAQIKAGESVAVFGCGGIGLPVIMGAAMVGAFPIHAFDIYSNKLQRVQKIGASNITLLNNEGESETWLGAFEVVVECTGEPEVIKQALAITASGGRLILAGLPRYDQVLTLNRLREHFTGKTVIFSEGGRTDPAVDIPRYLHLYREGKLKLDDLITGHYSLNEINEAIEHMKHGKAGKIIIKMED